ncbi:hypothetical protein BDV96DRAFT_633803 [Lophiotrema nucula]|uniref:F-box domain-containing protein n=1 Tax=Lophiotrema nucula TaxID=690887 RepID=A0A6A5YZH9_9PLEO|nr:hypothetical protein BDV96DRAFT_633803 [Lophiotrema nucula]
MMPQLPEELLLQVISELDQSSLAQLVRVSKQLHRICDALLYTHVAIIDRLESQSLHPLDRRILAFSTTVERRPTLARRILSLTLRFNNEIVSKKREETLFADIMTRLPNLRRLDCDISGGHPEYFSQLFAAAQAEASKRRQVDSRLKLPALKEVFIAGLSRQEITDELSSEDESNHSLNEDNHIYSSTLTMDAVARCAQALNPEKLLLFALKESIYAFDSNPDDSKPMLARTKHIEMRGTSFDPITIERLIKACASLETFVLHSLTTHSYGQQPVLKLLEQHSKTLQRLCLIGEGPVLMSSPSLGSFVALEQLRVSPGILLPNPFRADTYVFVDHLPPNLKRLCIVDVDYDVATRRALEAITHLVRSWNQVAPRLERIEIEGNPSEYYDMLLECYDLAKLTGLEFQVVETEVSIHTQNSDPKTGCAWGFDEDAEWPAPGGGSKRRREIIDMESKHPTSPSSYVQRIYYYEPVVTSPQEQFIYENYSLPQSIPKPWFPLLQRVRVRRQRTSGNIALRTQSQRKNSIPQTRAQILTHSRTFKQLEISFSHHEAPARRTSGADRNACRLPILTSKRGPHQNLVAVYLPLRALTTTIICRPELAVHVETLSIRRAWFRVSEAYQKSSVPDQELRPTLAAAIEDAAVNDKMMRRWKHDVERAGKPDALFALFVPRLANLKRLDIALSPDPGKRWTHMMRDASSFAGFELDELVLKGWDMNFVNNEWCGTHFIDEGTFDSQADEDEEGGEQQGKWYRFLGAHTILSHARKFRPKKLRVHSCGNTNYGRTIRVREIQLRLAEAASRSRTNTLPIEHLELRRADTDMDFIWNLLTACDALRAFIFEYRSGYWRIDDIVAMLLLHKDSLHDLYLDVKEAQHISPLRNLNDFAVLRELHIVAGLLLDRDRFSETTSGMQAVRQTVLEHLPKKLVRLRIMRGEQRERRLQEFLGVLLGYWKDVTPNLRIIDVEASGASSQSLFKLLEKVSIAEIAGVEMRVRVRTHLAPWTSDEERGWGLDGDECWPAPVGRQKEVFQPLTREIAEMVKEKEASNKGVARPNLAFGRGEF